MATGKREAQYRLVISLFCALIVGLQGATIIATIAGKPVWSWYWPIIDYPMYDLPHVEGDHVNATYLVDATLDDGKVVRITKESLGLSIWNFQILARSLGQGEPSSVKQLQQLFPTGDHLVEVRVRNLPVVVTRQGMREEPSVELNRIHVRAGR